MKFWTLIIFLFITNLKAEQLIPECSKKDLILKGIYSKNKHESDLLTQWSMEAGNLTRLKLVSKFQYKKIKISYFKDNKSLFDKMINLEKNQSNDFDFLEMLTKNAANANLVYFSVFDKQEIEECHYKTEILVNDSEQVEKQINVIK